MAIRLNQTPNPPRRTVKLLLFSALSVVSLWMLTCGGQQSETESKTVIKFWQFWTEPRVKAVVMQAVDDFEKKFPMYDVQVTDLTWDNGYQKIVAAFASGEVPDLLELGSDWIPQFAAAGALMDLSRECAFYMDTLAGWPPVVYDNICWALPWYLSTRVLYQNNDIARIVNGDDRHPIIWKELLEGARKATVRKPAMWGYGMQAAERHRLYKAFLPYLWSTGGQVLTSDNSECVLDSKEGRDALTLFVNLGAAGLIDKQATLEEQFIAGKILYLLSGDWLYEKLKRSGSSVDYSAFMLPFPAPGEGEQISFAGGEYLAIPRKAEHRLEGLVLARHLLSEKNVFNLCVATGNATPVHRDVALDPYFMKDPVRQIFIRQISKTKWSPSHPRWVEMESALEWGLEQALYRRMPIDDALTEICVQINEILLDYRNKAGEQ